LAEQFKFEGCAHAHAEKHRLIPISIQIDIEWKQLVSLQGESGEGGHFFDANDVIIPADDVCLCVSAADVII